MATHPASAAPSHSLEKAFAAPHFHFLDALRGVAAMVVMFYHLGVCHAFAPIMWQGLPKVLQDLFVLGSHGVEIFFLLSGFVITYSMCRFDAAARLQSQPIGLFLLRRWLRLTPPYLGACLLAMALLFLEARLKHEWPQSLDGGTILTNLFYLQSLFGSPDLFAPAWSLVVEVQFYLFFAIILWLCYRFRGPAFFLYSAAFVTGAASLFWPWIGGETRFLFPHWCHFAAGVLIYLTLSRPAYRLPTAAYLVFTGISGFLYLQRGQTDLRSMSFAMFAAGVGGALIWLLGEFRLLSRLGNGRLWQWLGAISYSLYLVHMQIGIFSMKTALKVFGERPALGWLSFLFTCGVCIGVAQLFHWSLERPAIRWSSALKRRRSAAPLPELARAVQAEPAPLGASEPN